MELAPVALFIYRRPEHTRRTLTALSACTELASSPLYVFCDGAKAPDAVTSVREARAVARQLAPKSAIFVEHERNQGLARSIIAGTTELTERFGKVIVVEDDLEVAPSFLRFMNAGLERYARDEEVMQVSGYQFPLDPPLSERSLFLGFPTSWGWATWARAWRHFDASASQHRALDDDPELRRRFDLDGSYPYYAMLQRQLRGKIDSWAIRWHLSVFMRRGLVLYPGRSLVRNTGFDGSGTHGARGTGFADRSVSDRADEDWQFPPVALDHAAQTRVYSFLASQSALARSRQLKNLASKWTRVILENRLVPPAVRAVGTSLLARVVGGASDAGSQDLGLYWDPKMAAILETWGIGNAWNEIQLLLANVRGKVVDIACGTGKVMTMLAPYPALEVHGFDVSDYLIQKALDRGIPRDRLAVADATKTPYADDQFDYGYSIGSLEHFTEEGILQFVSETYRITRFASFHQIPVARSGRNEGWMKTHQSFHNNSVAWWVERYRSAYPTVHVLDSAWNDKISVGKWFVCVREEPK
jgi:hypothetical protein